MEEIKEGQSLCIQSSQTHEQALLELQKVALGTLNPIYNTFIIKKERKN